MVLRWFYMISRLIIQSLAMTNRYHHVQARDLFCFFLLCTQLLRSHYVLCTVYLNQKSGEGESKARLSINRERRVNAHSLDISQATVVAAQIFDVLFFFLFDSQSRADFIRILIK